MIQIGKIIWYMRENNGNPIKGKIYDIFDHESIKEVSCCIVVQDDKPETECRLESECYETREECMKAIEERDAARKEEIEKRVQTKDDLLDFVEEHFFENGYIHDSCAKEIVKNAYNRLKDED